MKKTQKFTQSTETKLEGREHKAKDEVFKVSIRTFASALIALSGLVIFTDKVFSFELTELYGFYDEQTFVWMLSITIAPMLFCLGAIFKPYKISFLVPVYVSAIQLFWIFNPHIQFDDTFLQSYAIGAVLIIALLASIIHSLFNRAYEKRNQRIAQQAMDLDLEPVVKILIQFIVKHTQRKYISMLPREDQKNYRKDWLDTLREIDERSIWVLRNKKRLKQEELAEICNMDQRTLSNYENNKNLPSAKRLKLIADVLGQEWRLRDK